MLVGYRLVEDATGAVVREWGGTWGQTPGIPTRLDLPTDPPMQVYALKPGESASGFTLQEWWMDAPPEAPADAAP